MADWYTPRRGAFDADDEYLSTQAAKRATVPPKAGDEGGIYRGICTDCDREFTTNVRSHGDQCWQCSEAEHAVYQASYEDIAQLYPGDASPKVGKPWRRT